MELYQLRQFAAVAKYENMTRAAESLNVAQPAVSKTIRNLESELGAELFERTGKGLRRTEQGDILLRYARTILEAERDARGEIEESLHRTGGLCICALSCGMGVALVASGEWRQVCEDAGVRLLHIKDAQCRRYIYVQTLGRFRTQSIRAFTAYLERYFAQMT